MKNEEEIRNWKSYLTGWSLLPIAILIALWDNEFVFDNPTIAYFCCIFATISGIISFFFVGYPLVIEKIGFKPFFNKTNWLPFSIDLALLFIALVVLFQTSIRLFNFSIVLILSLTLLTLLFMRLRLIITPNKIRNSKPRRN